MSSPVFRNVGLNWGIDNQCSAFGSFIPSRHKFAKKGTKKEIKDGAGNTVGLVYYDLNQTSTFEYAPSSATVNGSASVAFPSIGDQLTMTSTNFSQSAGTWYCDDVSSDGKTDSEKMVTVEMTQYLTF